MEKKERVAFRALPGTRQRLAELARRSGKRPYTLAGELLAAALAAAEVVLPAAAPAKAEEQAA